MGQLGQSKPDLALHTLPQSASMNDPVVITLLGQPVPWARSGSRGSIRFTPDKQRNNAATLRLSAIQAMQDWSSADGSGLRPMFENAVRMDVLAEFQIPKSWSKRKQAAAITSEYQHSIKPDIDNIVKQIKDALKGIVYRDDALVAELHARKRYGVRPKLVIIVTPL